MKKMRGYIQGLTVKNGWVPFKTGENYIALLIARK